MMEPGRQWAVDSSMFGYNDKEKTDEITGRGNSYDFGERMYDARVSRFWSIDPMQKKFPFISPYLFAGNDPINFLDYNGTQQIRPSNGFNVYPEVPYAEGVNGYRSINQSRYSQQFGRADNTVRTIPINQVYITSEGYEGMWNGIQTVPGTGPTAIEQAPPLVFQLVADLGANHHQKSYDIGFRKEVLEGTANYFPTGDEQNKFEILSLEQAYQNGLQQMIEKNIKDSGIKEFDEQGNKIFTYESSKKVIESTTKLAYRIQNGPSPMEQFEAWAKSMEKSGKFKPGPKVYEPEITDGTKDPIVR